MPITMSSWPMAERNGREAALDWVMGSLAMLVLYRGADIGAQAEGGRFRGMTGHRTATLNRPKMTHIASRGLGGPAQGCMIRSARDLWQSASGSSAERSFGHNDHEITPTGVCFDS